MYLAPNYTELIEEAWSWHTTEECSRMEPRCNPSICSGAKHIHRGRMAFTVHVAGKVDCTQTEK